jgi:hypothetical protein
MEPIKLIGITTKEICDDWDGTEDLVTKYEPIYEYDDDDNDQSIFGII